MSNWTCSHCNAINPQRRFRCHNCSNTCGDEYWYTTEGKAAREANTPTVNNVNGHTNPANKESDLEAAEKLHSFPSLRELAEEILRGAHGKAEDVANRLWEWAQEDFLAGIQYARQAKAPEESEVGSQSDWEKLKKEFFQNELEPIKDKNLAMNGRKGAVCLDVGAHLGWNKAIELIARPLLAQYEKERDQLTEWDKMVGRLTKERDELKAEVEALREDLEATRNIAAVEFKEHRKWKEEYEELCKFANDYEEQRDTLRASLAEAINGFEYIKSCIRFDREVCPVVLKCNEALAKLRGEAPAGEGKDG